MRPYYALAVLPFLTGCGSEPALKAVSTSVTRMRVETVAAAEADYPSTYEATGTVRAKTTATACAQDSRLSCWTLATSKRRWRGRKPGARR